MNQKKIGNFFAKASPEPELCDLENIGGPSTPSSLLGPSFAYSLPVHSFHTRRDRVASLPPCRLYGAAMRSAPPLGLGVRLTLPCGWNNAGHQQI